MERLPEACPTCAGPVPEWVSDLNLYLPPVPATRWHPSRSLSWSGGSGLMGSCQGVGESISEAGADRRAASAGTLFPSNGAFATRAPRLPQALFLQRSLPGGGGRATPHHPQHPVIPHVQVWKETEYGVYFSWPLPFCFLFFDVRF